MIESWMISGIIAIVGIVASYAILKTNVAKGIESDKRQDDQLIVLNKFMNESQPFLKHISKFEDESVDDVNEITKTLTSLTVKIEQMPTMKEVREEFVSKEIFLQMEKHMDGKFDALQVMLVKVLDNQEKMIK